MNASLTQDVNLASSACQRSISSKDNQMISEDNICHPDLTTNLNRCSSQFQTDQKITFQNCNINFPEKIIFVVDRICESKATFKLNAGLYSPLYMIKRVIEIFFHNKLIINEKHEFALLSIDDEKAHWSCDFTGNCKIFLNSLESIEEKIKYSNEKYFDMQQVFELVHKQVNSTKHILKNNVIRIILLYSRSNTIPKYNILERSVQELISNHNFFLDILYIHEPLTQENKCKEIYAELSRLDIKNVSYIMEVSTNAVKLHNYMARLLAHPIQRVPQKRIKYSIHSSILQKS